MFVLRLWDPMVSGPLRDPVVPGPLLVVLHALQTVCERLFICSLVLSIAATTTTTTNKFFQYLRNYYY